MYHKHHKIPKHVGGSNSPDNLIELSIEEHAEAHKQLYEMYGRWQDKIAWQTLSGQITNAEAIKTAQKLGRLGIKCSDESKHKMRIAKLGKSQSEEHIAKRRDSLTGKSRKFKEKELWAAKISESKKGTISGFKGKKHTESAKEQNRLAHMGHSYNKGRVFSKVLCSNCGKSYATNVISRHTISCIDKA